MGRILSLFLYLYFTYFAFSANSPTDVHVITPLKCLETLAPTKLRWDTLGELPAVRKKRIFDNYEEVISEQLKQHSIIDPSQPLRVEKIGGESLIWLATDRSGKPIIIKVPKSSWLMHDGVRPEVRKFYDKEMKYGGETLYKISSVSYGDKNIPILIMPKLNNTFENAYYKEKLPLPFRMKLYLKLVTEVASYHEKGLIHRDIKPEQFLYDGTQWRLIDLGHVYDPKTEKYDGTKLQSRPYFDLKVDPYSEPTPSVDVYALKIILIEMLLEMNIANEYNILKPLPFILTEVTTQGDMRVKGLRQLKENDFDHFKKPVHPKLKQLILDMQNPKMIPDATVLKKRFQEILPLFQEK